MTVAFSDKLVTLFLRDGERLDLQDLSSTFIQLQPVLLSRPDVLRQLAFDGRAKLLDFVVLLAQEVERDFGGLLDQFLTRMQVAPSRRAEATSIVRVMVMVMVQRTKRVQAPGTLLDSMIAQDPSLHQLGAADRSVETSVEKNP